MLVCFVKINNVIRDSLFSFDIVLSVQIFGSSTKLHASPFHRAESSKELHAQLLQQSLSSQRIHSGSPLLTIYSISRSRLFPSRGITVSIKLNQFMTRLRGRAYTQYTHTQVRLLHTYTILYRTHLPRSGRRRCSVRSVWKPLSSSPLGTIVV